jgi:riboflavin transporter FmnP
MGEKMDESPCLRAFLPFRKGGIFMTKRKFDTRKLVVLSMFCALAYVVTLVFHIKVGFLTFDVKDAVVCIASMLFGPLAGVIIAFVVATIETLSVSDTGFWGWLMNFASTAVFAAVASALYRHFKKMWSAVAGLTVAVVATTATMLLLNILVTPIYMKVPTETVLTMLPKLLFPFNLLKSLLNASLVMLFYKPLSTVLKKARVLPAGETDGTYCLSWKSACFMLAALLLAVGCCVVIFTVLDGEFIFDLFKA